MGREGLNFNFHISTICKSASSQLNALAQLKKFLSFEQKVLVSSSILSNFDYCPLVWFISSAKSLKKVENLQKRALRFLQNEYHSSYETLLHKSWKTTVNVWNLRTLCKEIFKSLNKLNPVFLKEIFYFKESNRRVREKYKLNLRIPKIKQVRFGTKSLRGLGPKISNTLPYHIKTSENIGIDVQAKECTSLIIESKERFIAKMSAKLDNPKTVLKTYWSIINKFLSNKKNSYYTTCSC